MCTLSLWTLTNIKLSILVNLLLKEEVEEVPVLLYQEFSTGDYTICWSLSLTLASISVPDVLYMLLLSRQNPQRVGVTASFKFLMLFWNCLSCFKPYYLSGRKRQLSECSNLTEDEDGEGEEGGMGNFTSTVCVNFSEDDLRLATIPGQVMVMME